MTAPKKSCDFNFPIISWVLMVIVMSILMVQNISLHGQTTRLEDQFRQDMTDFNMRLNDLENQKVEYEDNTNARLTSLADAAGLEWQYPPQQEGKFVKKGTSRP